MRHGSSLLRSRAAHVPLRSTFTYSVPEQYDGEPLIGRRVVVPFRNRSMVGLCVSESDHAPEEVRSKPVAGLMDSVPALPPKLIELAHWISRYYVAPIGETLRAMLPPEIELRHDREYSLTDAGRAHLRELVLTDEGSDIENAEREMLRHCEEEKRSVSSAMIRRWPGGDVAAERLLKRGLLSAREVLRARKTRMQKIVAWNEENSAPATGAAEEKVREVLTATRGPLPFGLLMEKAQVSRAILLRLEKKGRLVSWEEPHTIAEDAWDTEFTPPANILNPEQKEARSRSLAVAGCRKIHGRFATWRHRQRQDGGVSGRDRSGSFPRENRNRAGSGNCTHFMGGPTCARRFGATVAGAAQRVAGHRTRKGMVARSARRSARHRRNALGRVCSARKSRPDHCG